MKKNESLYNLIENALSDGNKMKFGEIKALVNARLYSENYSEKQLRNALYRQVKKGIMSRDADGRYSMNYLASNSINSEKHMVDAVNEKKATVFDIYKEDILRICKETEKKLKNPFESFSDDEILDAKKTYELNKKIMFEISRNVL